MTDREYTLLAEIRALKADYMALQQDSAWREQEHARALEVYQEANNALADENAGLVEQLADAQLIVDGQAHLTRKLKADLAVCAIEAQWPGITKVEIRSN